MIPTKSVYLQRPSASHAKPSARHARGPRDTEGMTAEPELIVCTDGAVGRIRLNRPRAINALTLGMIRGIAEALDRFEDDPAISLVALDGAGERGLCSGADVRGIREVMLEPGADPLAFFQEEYALNARIADFPKPYVSFMDGIVMGGGIGLSAYGSLRLVTGRTQAAMPETGIGLSPDVGAMFPLSRAPGQIGTHLAMTGDTFSGADAIAVGLADAEIDAEAWEETLGAVASGEHSAVGAQPTAPLLAERGWIDECYAGDDPVAILDRLRSHPSPKANAAADLIASRSPLAVAVALAALRRAATLPTLRDVLAQDLHLAATYAPVSDFIEGVRARLVDKDGRPRWQHASLQDIPAHLVVSFFS